MIRKPASGGHDARLRPVPSTKLSRRRWLLRGALVTILSAGAGCHPTAAIAAHSDGVTHWTSAVEHVVARESPHDASVTALLPPLLPPPLLPLPSPSMLTALPLESSLELPPSQQNSLTLQRLLPLPPPPPPLLLQTHSDAPGLPCDYDDRIPSAVSLTLPPRQRQLPMRPLRKNKLQQLLHQQQQQQRLQLLAVSLPRPAVARPTAEETPVHLASDREPAPVQTAVTPIVWRILVVAPRDRNQVAAGASVAGGGKSRTPTPPIRATAGSALTPVTSQRDTKLLLSRPVLPDSGYVPTFVGGSLAFVKNRASS